MMASGGKKNGVIRNDVLSQSYAECVERVAQQKNDAGGFTFDLPKEVLEEREKVWGNFFDKYANEGSDEIELDMNTMKPIAAAKEGEEEEEEEEDDEDEDDDAEDDEDDEYFSKCRAPLRKLPALIQYWIDTGNPPYQLVFDGDVSETGSSLSEGERSRTGNSAFLREPSDKQKSNSSHCSSVDTAAYILSNTNTTKKSETIAILKGAKISDENLVSKASPNDKEKSSQSVDNPESAIFTSPNRDPKSSVKMTQPSTVKILKSTSEFERTSPTSASKTAQANHSTDLASKLLDVSMTTQQSVRLSEILPELQQFDEMLEKEKELSPPKSRSALGFVRKPAKVFQAEIEGKEASSSSQNTSSFPSAQNRLQNRRKLYTGRDSPVDLALDKTKDAVVQYSVRRSLHPALETPSTRQDKIARLTARVRRRKRKRASQISEINSQDGNTSQESDQPTGQENSKSDARYTDFFESLGLTPSKTLVGKPRFRKPAIKRSKKIERPLLHRQAKNVPPINDSIESSLKESSQTEDSVFSPVKNAQNSPESEPTEFPSGTEEQKRILGDKILRVRIEKLSDDFVARYKRISVNKASEKIGVNESQILTTTSSSSSSGKKDKCSELEKIELLTTVTHDSDSSTILICSCNDNVETCDSDRKTGLKNVTRKRRRTLRTRGSKINTKSVSDDGKSEFTENSDKLPFEEEKMDSENSSNPETKLNKFGDRKNSKIVFKTSLSPLSHRSRSSLRNGKKSDLFGSTDVTIGSRIFGKTNSNENEENSREKSIVTRARCSLGISIPSDEEEDSFVKLISEIGSQRNSTKVEDVNDKETKIKDTEAFNLKNDIRRSRMEKLRKPSAIIMSSDEEDVYVRQSKRRARNSDSRNDEKSRETRKIKDNNLVTEAKEKEENEKKDNQIDDSEGKKGKKITSENDTKVSVNENRRTRASRGYGKSKNNILLASNVEKEVNDGNESQKNGSRREKAKNQIFASKDEVAMEVDDSESLRNKNVRRSTRYKLSGASLSKNQSPVKDLLGNSKNTNTLFAKSKSTGLRDAVVLLTEDDRDMGLKKRNLGTVSFTVTDDQSEKSKDRVTPHVPRDAKKILRNSLRFKTRLDSDSDAEFEGLRFSLNDKYIPRSSKKSSSQVGIGESKEMQIFHENKPEIETTETIRTSPRRRFKSLLDNQPVNDGNELKKRRRNLFDEESKGTERKVDSLEDEATNVEEFWKNGSALLNDFPLMEHKNSDDKQTKITSQVESKTKRKSRNNSKKFDLSKNQSIIGNKRRNESRNSSPTKKKKIRKARILGNSKEWETEDETDSNDNKMRTRIDNRSKEVESLTNDNRSTQSRKKDAIGDRETSKKYQSTDRLFPTSPEEIAEDVDLLFSSVTNSRGAKNVVLVPKLNFANFTKQKNLNSTGMSSIRFRTRLRSDTEDDEEL